MVTSAAAQSSAQPTPLGVDIPHIALLLPVDSSTFRRHAEALRDGFIAASQIPDPGNMLIRVYPVGEDPTRAVASYRQAVSTGARLVVGPLVRAAVTAVAREVSAVPTLLLNTPDGELPNRPNLYLISLLIEAEASQAAHLAFREGRRAAYTVVGRGAVLQRAQQAFIDAFVRLGGRHVGTFNYGASPLEIERLRSAVAGQAADMVFLALNVREASSVRPALDPLPLYASSQAYSPEPATLAGVRMLDMPWLVEQDHPAVMIYPRQDYGDPDLDRLYALGIDAWRIGQAMLARHSEITLDGVTGKLALQRNRQFSRELVVRHSSDGLAAIPPGPIAPTAPIAFPPATRHSPRP